MGGGGFQVVVPPLFADGNAGPPARRTRSDLDITRRARVAMRLVSARNSAVNSAQNIDYFYDASRAPKLN